MQGGYPKFFDNTSYTPCGQDDGCKGTIETLPVSTAQCTTFGHP